MRVKVFSGDNHPKLEEAINTWLAQHPEIHIWFIRQTENVGGIDKIGYVVITVWYEGKEDKDAVSKEGN